MDGATARRGRSQRTQAVRWRIARRHLNARKTHRLRWTLLIFMVLMLASVGAGGAGAYYWVSKLPSASAFHIHYAFQNAHIYDSRGDLLFNMADLRKSAGRRLVEPLQARGDPANPCRAGVDRIPLLLQNATIATEDATFYKNPGFDLPSIVRAAYDDITLGHVVSGASTITQQVVRSAHLVSDAPTLQRKAKEIALAYELSKRLSKRQILWYYLNSVSYGNTAVGAQAAAEVYFGRRVCAIDRTQAAFLAGLPQAPSVYDPVRFPGRALTRLHEVLTLERKHGVLHTRAQIGAAMAEARQWHFTAPSAPMRFPAFTRYVIDQINTMPRIRSQLYKGIDIYTTIDPRLQASAQYQVTSKIDGLVAQHVTDGALVSLDLRPQHYGWILAMVGSAKYNASGGQINMANTPRQPGSSMKPFNYIYAFQHGVGPGTTVLDTPLQLPDPSDTLDHGWYVPQNYDHQFHGPVTIRQALANSLNIPAVKTEYYVTGAQHVAQTAARYGMSSLFRDNPGIGCSVCYATTLGGLSAGTRLVEETAAYGVFATGGLTVPPIAIWKVVRRSTGQVLFCSADCPAGSKPAPWVARGPHRVLDAGHAYEMTDVLSDNAARCTPQVCEFGLNSPLVLSHPAAAKTGTTNDYTDNWTIGYTPQIVTGVWAGNADRTPMVNVIGITGAAPIWNAYMESAFQILHLPSVWYTPPVSIQRTNQCTSVGAASPGIAPTPVPPGGTTTVAPSGTGNTDIYVSGDRLPDCSLPDHGTMPVTCEAYPRPLPVGWECVNETSPGLYRYYTVGPNGQYQYYYGPAPTQGTTGTTQPPATGPATGFGTP